jgi:serine phosphatase RsbU (regulator of sigma subunit)
LKLARSGHDNTVIDHLFEAAPIGLGVLDRDLRWVRVNDAMAALQQRPRDDLIGRRPSELHPGVGARVENIAREVLVTGRTLHRRMDGQVGGETGNMRWWDMAWFPVDDSVGMAAVEITDRVRAERELAEAHRRDALMARASHLLSSAITVKESADLVAQLVVPELADWCFVELVRDGRIDRVASLHRDPEKGKLIEHFDRAFPLDPDSPVGSPKVIRTGKPELIAEVPDELLVQAAESEEHLVLLREVGFKSACIVPLIARGRILGDIALATDGESGRCFGPDTLDVARALADRAALALDNAALYAQREQVALTLQEELLPPRLPPIPGLDVAARYSAAGEGNQVGGDFYDVFASDNGWQVVIGDVVGKGPAAAAVTGLARHTMRAAAAYEGAPSQLLRLLNAALLAERPGRRLASVACVRIDPEAEGAQLTVSVAGHPLPLVVNMDGSVREVGRFGQLLGVEEELVVFDTSDHLAPGELLLLYTDGVIEARGPGGLFGEQHLRSLMMTLGGEAPTRVLQRVEAAVLAASGGRPRDDVAMVALRMRSLP